MSHKAKKDSIEDMHLSVDFSIGPGIAGQQLPHVKAGIQAFTDRDLTDHSDGIVSRCDGTLEQLADAIRDSILQAFRSGAKHYRLVVTQPAPSAGLGWKQVEALEPVVRSLGGQIVPLHDIRPEDIPLEWDGRILVGVREATTGTVLEEVLHSHIAQAETRFGPLDKLDREGRWHAIAWFKEQNTFHVRYSVETIATKMGVSRATIYNYIKAAKA